MIIGDPDCERCGKRLEGRQRRYCSGSCRVAEWRDDKREQQWRKCEVCGDPFAVRYRHQRVCDYNSGQASEDCAGLQDELAYAQEDADLERMTAACEREGCEVKVYRPGRGRPKRFCSHRCKTAFYRSQRKAAANG